MPDAPVLIRAAVPEDVEQLAAVHVASWRVAYRGIIPDRILDNLSLARRQANWLRALEEPGEQGNLVCLAGGRVIGFASFGPTRDEDDDAAVTAELMALYVHPEHWRQGAGTRLWHEVQRRVVGRYREITLWVLCENERARRFYERIGFVAEPERVKALPRFDAEMYEVRYRRAL
jgi:ribosomal protein S18 acetylase RimI-like enzyme